MDPTEDQGPTLAQFKEEGQAILNELLKINLGIENEHSPTFITGNTLLIIKELILTFKRKTGCFCLDIYCNPGLDYEISMHSLFVGADKLPVKQ